MSLVNGGRESALKMGNFILSIMCDMFIQNRIHKNINLTITCIRIGQIQMTILNLHSLN